MIEHKSESKVFYVDIVTSALNEEDAIDLLYKEIIKVFQNLTEYRWRLLICDNGSTDGTWSRIRRIGISDSRVVGLRMSRTFSFDEALSCLLQYTSGDFAILMASDLQDDPRYITEFLEQLRNGWDMTVGQVVSRKGIPKSLRIFTKLYYSLASRATNGTILDNVSDYRGINKKVYLTLRQMKEKNRFLRGMLGWVGFKTKVIPIRRPPRRTGKSSFQALGFIKRINWALGTIFNFTSAPLISVFAIGVFLAILSFAGILIGAIIWFIFGVPFAGYGTLTSIILLGFSTIITIQGIMARYIAILFDEVKSRPSWIVSETLNIVEQI